VLPLRHLVVVIDPDSKTSPRRILERWKGLMRIDIWDEAFFQKPISRAERRAYRNNTQLMEHRHRQTTFYVKFLRTFHKLGIPWILLTDTDEFITLDYRGLFAHKNPLFQELARNYPIETPGSILQALMHYEQATGKTQKCLFVPRYTVGSLEANTSLVESFLPKDTQMNPHQFLTQRYLYQNPVKMENGKNLMHVTSVPTVRANPNVHLVSLHCPGRDFADAIETSQIFKIHHYVGTLEQFSFRSDPRKQSKVAQFYATKGEGATDLYTHSQGWIQGFIQDVGLEKAKQLLAGVGQVGHSKGMAELVG
jgi:hypothetical protein